MNRHARYFAMPTHSHEFQELNYLLQGQCTQWIGHSIIDKIGELALTKALKSGKIYAAGLDVLSEEPATKNIEFFQLDNVRITQHIAWGSQETNLRAIAIALDNLVNYLQDQPTSVIS
jgi:hypothetical protein